MQLLVFLAMVLYTARREAGSGLQVMLVHTALICVPGTNPGLQL